MKKVLVSWLFALAMGYIFIELQRVLAGVHISNVEWLGFLVFIGVAWWLWKRGEEIDAADRQERKEENEERDQKLIKALKTALKEEGGNEHRENKG